MERSFFPGDEPALVAALDDYLAHLATRAEKLPGFRALLLGGGYGRGEGGIFIPADGGPARLYNDLEFYYFGDAPGEAALDEWRHEGERRLGIEIEFKVMSPDALQRARPSMFYYDLLSRHVPVAGDAAWAGGLPAVLSDAAAIPPEEAARLLVNRGMSLLRCLRWSAGEIHLPEGFCDRIAAKLKMALADAVLCVTGRYHWSCLERDRRAAALPADVPLRERLRSMHAEGVTFKLRPRHEGLAPSDWRLPLEELRQAWLSTFLWCEGRRRQGSFAGARGYAAQRGRLFPSEARGANILRHLRDFRRRGRVPFSLSDHPRAAVWKSLALLLERPADEAAAARLLGARRLRGHDLEEHCRACWRHYP